LATVVSSATNILKHYRTEDIYVWLGHGALWHFI